MSGYVFDSFALLAWWRREEGRPRVNEILGARTARWMTVINLGEVYYRIAQETNTVLASQALTIVERLPVAFVEIDQALALAAANIKARYPLSYADCFAAALARQLDAAVVTGDREFRPLEEAGVVAVEWLPRARARR